jgi:hypothetical protein
LDALIAQLVGAGIPEEKPVVMEAVTVEGRLGCGCQAQIVSRADETSGGAHRSQPPFYLRRAIRGAKKRRRLYYGGVRGIQTASR